MKTTLLEQVLTKEINSFSKELDLNKKDLLYDLLFSNILKQLEDESLNELPPNQQSYVIGHMARSGVAEGMKLFKTKISEEFYNFIFNELIEGILKVVITCIKADFDKDERLTLIREEAHISLLFPISVLRDEEKIDDQTYKHAMVVLKR